MEDDKEEMRVAFCWIMVDYWWRRAAMAGSRVDGVAIGEGGGGDVMGGGLGGGGTGGG